MNPDVLALLVCPVCHGALAGRALDAVACVQCGRVYPVRDSIPLLVAADPGGASGGTGV